LFTLDSLFLYSRRMEGGVTADPSTWPEVEGPLSVNNWKFYQLKYREQFVASLTFNFVL